MSILAIALSTVYPLGGPIMLLGVNFDNKLIMANAGDKCAAVAAWKIKALLRPRRFYSTLEFVLLYKNGLLLCAKCSCVTNFA